MNKFNQTLFALTAVAFTAAAIPASAGGLRDRVEDGLDRIESRIDRRTDNGPLDRIEDRVDRLEDRADRADRPTPTWLKRWERRSIRRTLRNGS